MSVTQYEGHSARTEYDAADRIFVGHLAGIDDRVGFHATAVDEDIATCALLGKQPERAFSGKVMFRISPEIHAKAALAAQLEGKILNQWASEVLSAAAERKRA